MAKRQDLCCRGYPFWLRLVWHGHVQGLEETRGAEPLRRHLMGSQHSHEISEAIAVQISGQLKIISNREQEKLGVLTARGQRKLIVRPHREQTIKTCRSIGERKLLHIDPLRAHALRESCQSVHAHMGYLSS
ncbi:hypothetical protein D3C77_629160 [compost metagenome]